MAKKILLVNGQEVEVSKNKKQKNLYLRVLSPDGKVTVSAPYRVADQTIEAFIIKNWRLVLEEQDKLKKEGILAVHNYSDGEKCYLWGQEFTLRLHEGSLRNNFGKIKDDVHLYFSSRPDKELIEKVLNEFYRAELKAKINDLSPTCESLVGVKAKEYRVKNMKTRWGTCNIQEARIWINLQLAKYPLEYLELVLCHELVHLLERNHNTRFYQLLHQAYPNYLQAEAALKEKAKYG